MVNMRLGSLIFSAILLLILVGCGGGSKEQDQAATPTVQATTSTATTPVPTASVTVAPSQANAGSVSDLISRVVGKFAPVEIDNVRYGGTFRLGTEVSVGNWDPKFAPGRFDAARWVYSKLVEFVPNENNAFGHLAPGLAEKWSISDDLKTFTFTLRKGVKFHNIAPVNGRELVADDVVYSHRRYMEKDSTSFGSYTEVESIDAVDKYTVQFKMKSPNVWALEDLFRTVQYVVPKEFIEQSGGVSSYGIGTGPYILKDYGNRRGGLFVRNPDYSLKDSKGNALPYTDELREIYVTDPATSLAGMRTNQFDTSISFGTLDITAALLKSTPSLRFFSTDFVNDDGLTFNMSHAPWNDVRVRRAISMLYDRSKLASQILSSPESNWKWSSAVPWSAVSDEPFKYDDYGPYYKYDPEAAKKLLIEAGFPDGKITVPNPVVSRSPGYDSWILATQQLFKENGIEMTMLPLDSTSYSIYNATRQIKDIGIQTNTTGNMTLYWGASNLFIEENPVNQAHVSDPEIRNVVFQIRATTDPAKLKDLARKLWDYDTLQVPRMWTAREKGVSVTSARARNVTERSGRLSIIFWMPWLADATRTSP